MLFIVKKRLLTVKNLFSLFILLLIPVNYALQIEVPSRLVTLFLPMLMVLFFTSKAVEKGIYPTLPYKVNVFIFIAFSLLTLLAGAYIFVNFLPLHFTILLPPIATAAGLIILLLLLEVCRQSNLVIFLLIMALTAYLLGSYYLPFIPRYFGVSFSQYMELAVFGFSDGIFGYLTQYTVTIIAPLLIFAGTLEGTGVLDSIIRIIKRGALRWRAISEQLSPLCGMMIGAVSGSGVTNVLINAPYVVPHMRGWGIPAYYSAAILTASGLGGLIMPPVLVITAFIMSEMLGISYYEVCLRILPIALIYYLSLMMHAHFIFKKFSKGKASKAIEEVKVIGKDKLNCLIFITVLSLLISCLACGFSVTFSIFTVSTVNLAVSFCSSLLSTNPFMEVKRILKNLYIAMVRSASSLCFLGLLLASLGVLTALFSAAGFLVELSMVFIRMKEINILLLSLLAFLLGYVLGLGLPVTATYILFVIIVAPLFVKLGIGLTQIHFFGLLMGVVSEISPPVAVAASVAAKIMNESPIKVTMTTCRLAASLFILPFAVFLHPNLTEAFTLNQLTTSLILAPSISAFSFGLFAVTSTHAKLRHRILSSVAVIVGALNVYYANPMLSVTGLALLIWLLLKL